MWKRRKSLLICVICCVCGCTGDKRGLTGQRPLVYNSQKAVNECERTDFATF